MSQVQAIAEIRNKMIEAIKLLAKSGDQKAMMWRGQGGQTYIEVKVAVKHKNDYCETNYTILTDKGELFRHTPNKGAFCDLRYLDVEQVAEIYDQLFAN